MLYKMIYAEAVVVLFTCLIALVEAQRSRTLAAQATRFGGRVGRSRARFGHPPLPVPGEPGRRPLRMTARARGRHGRRPSLRRHGTLRHGMVPYPPPTPFVRPTRHMYPEFNTFARFPAPRFTYPRRRFPRGPGRYFPPIPSAHRPVTATRRCEGHHLDGTCHYYMHVMDGGCHGKRYTFEHCPRFFMCCYTEDTHSDSTTDPDTETTTEIPTDSSSGTGTSAECTYSGSTYTSGDTFPDVDGCNNCQCTIVGGVICTSNIC